MKTQPVIKLKIIVLEKENAEIDSNINSYNGDISILKQDLENLELNPDYYIDSYDEMLDESYEDFMGQYSTSYTLKNIDEIAYRCGLNDYVDGFEIPETEEYKDIEEKISDLEFLRKFKSKSTLTEEDALKLGAEVSKKVAARHKRSN